MLLLFNLNKMGTLFFFVYVNLKKFIDLISNKQCFILENFHLCIFQLMKSIFHMQVHLIV
jgi:hypothetical protein